MVFCVGNLCAMFAGRQFSQVRIPGIHHRCAVVVEVSAYAVQATSLLLYTDKTVERYLPQQSGIR